MKRIRRLIGRLLGRNGPELPQPSPDELETLFKSRYHAFKLLLAANNRGLELMAAMEQAQAEGQVYGMAFIRAHATALGVAVFQMIKNLTELAPDKYDVLFERFHAIQENINRVLESGRTMDDGPLVVPLDQVDREWADFIGAKMANLGEMKNRLGLRVPPGFVFTSRAYHLFFDHNELQPEINRLIQSATLDQMDQLFGLSSMIRQKIVRAEMPAQLAEAVQAEYTRLEAQIHPGVNVSLRSSALGEDSPEASFAGQYSSQLNVHRDNLFEAYKEVVASKYTPQAMHYRLMRGLRDEDVAMAVGCMAMVESVSGGVAYSRSALDQEDNRVYVTSVWGLPKSVVDGNALTDEFIVRRSPALTVDERRLAHKDQKYVCYPEEGVCRMVLTGDEADRPSLDDGHILELAELALKLEAHYGGPQDMEWAVDDQGRIILLQCRPLRPAEAGEPGLGQEPPVDAPVLVRGGVRASPGVASGPVFWVRKDQDALGFPQGAILAVTQTLPRWAALLGRAAGVVSEKGGMAGHLATVAREYGLPALFGLEEASGVLTDGRIITLCADDRTVYDGRVESLLARTPAHGGLMAESPVARCLKEILGHAAPLTLLDPDSSDFAPKNCQTLHDLTRFCHEKAVHEMFQFGTEHRFPLRASKQLFYKVPMQWWIINLDDGFRETVDGRYIRLEQIHSRPMKAVWAGMVAIPWDGPPAISGKGLASVMFQAATNPALATPFKTKYSQRNYIMVSSRFMNLQSRFGFHFCTVEALVSDRRAENYVGFSFRGGAADLSRRQARVHFLADILEERGFRVTLKEDTAAARFEGDDAAAMEEKLRLVGYLIMHTRQLDMIMAHSASVNHYGLKIRADLDRIAASEPV